MPLSGTHFTFGIPEGPDGIPDPFLGMGTSVLTLNITSAYDGKGILTSPNGYCQEFSFTSNNVTTIPLPYSFMHLKDLGKTNKGILFQTSQPVNVVFHNYFEAAGEATQIYPDAALGTDYHITSWGIFNDPGEDNHTQFIITAVQNNTDVTIIPSVKTLGNHLAGEPINITLNRGECYIVKADTSGVPIDHSLTHSIVTSFKPVSIFAGVTCGYVPLQEEACNELLDQILPRNITGTTFYVAPLRDKNVQNTVLFSSEKKDFFVLTTGGTNYASRNGRVEVQISSPQKYTVTEPAQCFLLSNGSALQDIGDPSIVTILPADQYSDTLLWFNPSFTSQGFPFDHYVSLIYPKASEGNILLDGAPIASVSAPRLIPASAMAAVVINTASGVHRITSPVPVFAAVAGFSLWDAYSFVAGSVSPKLPEDTSPVFLGISSTEAKTCREFDATVSANFHAAEDIRSVDLTLKYDPAILTLVSVQLGPTAQGGQWTTDTRTPGTILINASCLKSFTDSGAIALLKFSAGPAVTTTTLSGTIQVTGGESVYGIRHGSDLKRIDIQKVRDTLSAQFTVSGSTSVLGEVDTAMVSLSSVPNISVDEIDLFISYDHDVLQLNRADLTNTVVTGSTVSKATAIDSRTDEIKIAFQPSATLKAGLFVKLIFETFVSVSKSSSISVQATMLNSLPCTVDILATQVTGQFDGIDTCGTSALRALLRNEPFKINSIIPNPSNGSFTIDLDRHLFGDPLYISLLDVLGNEVWKTNYSSDYINEKIPCSIGSSLPAGSYFLRVSMPGHTETQKVIIRN